MPPNDTTDDPRWFNECLRPHEPMLRAWLLSQTSNKDDIDDIIQDAYLRVLKAHAEKRIRSPKSYLFATARNCALVRFRKSKVRSEISLDELDLSDVLDDSEDVQESVFRSEELEFLTKAIQSLPKRCRQIVTLRKIYGVPQKDIARQLGISESTVEGQGIIGMRKLAEYFRKYARD